MLMAFNKVCALSIALLVSLSYADSLSAQCDTCNSQPVSVQAADCGCGNVHHGFVGREDHIPMYEIVHGCRYKRDIANLWDGYCDEHRSYCDSDHEPKCGLFGCGSRVLGAKGCGLRGCGNMGCKGGGQAGCSNCAKPAIAPCGKAGCGCKGLPTSRQTGACNTGTCNAGCCKNGGKLGGLLHSLKGGCNKKGCADAGCADAGCADAGCADAGCADMVPAAAARPVVTPVPLSVALGASRAE